MNSKKSIVDKQGCLALLLHTIFYFYRTDFEYLPEKGSFIWICIFFKISQKMPFIDFKIISKFIKLKKHLSFLADRE